MVAMIAALEGDGFAYARDGHVLFRVRKYAGYGRLSGRSLDDMIAGARVEVAPYKEDPMDFVLWKPSGPDEPGWESPWGRGRPGWHIECSAMARELLGPAFDIHGGGIDLQFPHHENEIAQSCCADPDAGFARVWMHNEMVQVEGKKMSKSLGNFFTVRDLLDKGYDPSAIRLMFLETHYRKPMDFTEERYRASRNQLVRWDLATIQAVPAEVPPAVLTALADDLNTPEAITVLRKLRSDGDLGGLLAGIRFLGLKPIAMQSLFSTHEGVRHAIEQLLEERAEAKKSRDFARADALRDSLISAGISVKDTPQGIEWELGPDFDPAKLEAMK